jgi:hypothetical protein
MINSRPKEDNQIYRTDVALSAKSPHKGNAKKNEGNMASDLERCNLNGQFFNIVILTRMALQTNLKSEVLFPVKSRIQYVFCTTNSYSQNFDGRRIGLRYLGS